MANEDNELSARSAMHVHAGMVQWARDNGTELNGKSPVEILAFGFANRNKWRKTEQYRAIVEQYRGSAEDRKAKVTADRQAAKEAKQAERAAAAEAKAQAKAAAAAEKAAAKEAAPTKAAAKKAAAAPAKATKKATKASTTAEDPFA